MTLKSSLGDVGLYVCFYGGQQNDHMHQSKLE